MEIVLTTEENNLLVEVLDEKQRELERELARTSHHQFKTILKKRETLLESVLNKLKVSKLIHV